MSKHNGNRTWPSKDKSKRRGKLTGVAAQEREAENRAKFGPRMKPAPLIVRSLETGEVKARAELGRVPRPLSLSQRRLIVKLRAEAGVQITELPATSEAGGRVIDALLARKRELERLGLVERPAWLRGRGVA